MNPAHAIRRARRAAGLSKRALARRAGTSPAAIVAYETGRRDPTVGTLDRILRAAGVQGEISWHPAPLAPDRAEAARRLVQVLELADQLPRRAAPRRLAFPRLPDRPR